MKIIELICVQCNKKYNKEKREYTRICKLGNKTYCSNVCSAIATNNARRNRGEILGNLNNLKKGHGRIKDEYSPFRFFARKAKSRNKKHKWTNIELKIETLKNIWDTQQGICPLTGWRLVLPKSSSEWEKCSPSPNRASLDRIKPMKPYSNTNVRFVSYMANLCKHTFSDEEVIEFCKAVTNNQITYK